MSHFLLIPLFAAFVNVLLGIFVLSRDYRLRINQIFCAWGMALGAWNLGAFALFRVQSPAVALLWARSIHMGVIFIPVLMLHLSFLLTRRKTTRLITVLYVITFAMAATNFSPFFVSRVRPVAHGWMSVGGIGFNVFSKVFIPSFILPALFLLVKKMRTSPREQRRKYATLVLANTMLTVFGINDLFLVQGFDYYPGTKILIYPWGSFAASLYGVLVGYGVLHDQLLDMRVSLGRQAATILRIGFLLCFTYLLLTTIALIFPWSFTMVGFAFTLVVLALSTVVSSVLFPILIGGRSETLERKILGDRFEYQEQIRAFATGLTAFTEVSRVLDESAVILHQAMKLSFVEFVILDVYTQEVQYLCRRPPSLEKWAETITADASLFEYFRITGSAFLDCRNSGAGLFANEIEKTARTSVAGKNPEVVLRIGSVDGPFGVLLVGHKFDGTPMTKLDLELMLELSAQIGSSLDRIRLAEQAAIAAKQENFADLSRGLAHDLNGHITPISTYLQLQANAHESDPGLAELLRVATREMFTIRDYVQEAMFFATTLKPHKVTMDVSSMLHGVQEVCEERAKSAGVKVVVESPPESIKFLGDRILMQRMLANFVVNAIDASAPQQQVVMRAQVLTAARQSSKWLRLFVVDNGAGIPPEHLAKIFQPYFSTKVTGDKHRGFGLGLPLTQKVARLHGGQISVKSEVGKGTTMQVDLPLEVQVGRDLDRNPSTVASVA